MDTERILISTHVERTAGTSIQNLFQAAVGREKLSIYYARQDRLHRGQESAFTNASSPIDWLKATLMDTPFYATAKDLAFWLKSLTAKDDHIEIPPDVLIIHGHFRADRFDDIVDNPLRSIIFREPLERMRSQYDLWKRAKGHVEWRVAIPYDPNMSFEDYALLPQLQNYQTQATAGKPLSDFNVVGVTENLEQYEQGLMELFIEQGWCDAATLDKFSLLRLNQTSKLRRTDQSNLNDVFLREFRAFHAADYHLYDAARK